MEAITNDEVLILRAIDYGNMPFFTSKTALKIEAEVWQEASAELLYARLAVTVTKNFLGPKLVYSAQAGLFKDAIGERAIARVDLHIAEVSASIGLSTTHAEAGAKVTLAGGELSIVNFHLGVGVSSEVGIKDDSISLKVAGFGFKIGRKLEISVFDASLGIDFGKLFY